MKKNNKNLSLKLLIIIRVKVTTINLPEAVAVVIVEASPNSVEKSKAFIKVPKWAKLVNKIT